MYVCFSFSSLMGYYKLLSIISVLYSKPVLVIYFIHISVYMLTPASEFNPPYPDNLIHLLMDISVVPSFLQL